MGRIASLQNAGASQEIMHEAIDGYEAGPGLHPAVFAMPSAKQKAGERHVEDLVG